jgi:pimeloyl-ACP methyl ester carboxylesterase
VQLLAGVRGGARVSARPAVLWTPVRDAGLEALAEDLVLLVHGLDEQGGIWDDLAPALHGAGYHVARFDYPDDGPLTASADLLGRSLRDLRARGVRRVDIVCHSMGGLIARDVLTRPGVYAGRAVGHADLPDVERLIMFGTPNTGSRLARAEVLGEVRQQVARWEESAWARPPGRRSWRRGGTDGHGEAAGDLLPGSAYLVDLNARGLPEGVSITAVVGLVAQPEEGRLSRLASSRALELVTAGHGREVARGLASVAERVGDGVVPASSARLAGVEDTVVIGASHRGMLRRFPAERAVRRLLGGGVSPDPTPPGVRIVLARLGAV